MNIYGIIFRCGNKQRTAQFYERLGLKTKSHEHDGGPTHFEVTPLAPTCVLELYAASANHTDDAVIVQVPLIEAALIGLGDLLQDTNPNIVVQVGTRRAYIRDPDNRKVMLLQNC